jgi:hypothetical protein
VVHPHKTACNSLIIIHSGWLEVVNEEGESRRMKQASSNITGCNLIVFVIVQVTSVKYTSSSSSAAEASGSFFLH